MLLRIDKVAKFNGCILPLPRTAHEYCLGRWAHQNTLIEIPTEVRVRDLTNREGRLAERILGVLRQLIDDGLVEFIANAHG